MNRSATVEERSTSGWWRGVAAHQAWLALGIWWILLIVPTLGLSPLSSREGLLLHRAGSPLASSSPLFELVLWSISAIGPPAELLFRLLGLFAGALGAFAAYRLLSSLAPPIHSAKPIAWIAVFGLGCHGSVVMGLTSFSPMVLLWGGLAAIVLLGVEIVSSTRPSMTVLIGASLIGLLIVSTEPLALVLLLAIALWLGFFEKQRLGAIAILGPSALCVLALATMGFAVVPTSLRFDVDTLDSMAFAISGLRGSTQPSGEGQIDLVSPLVRVVAIVFTCLALTGLRRAPRALAALCSAMLVTGLGISSTRSGDVWSGTEHILAIFPLVVLGTHRITSMDQLGAFRKVWSSLIVCLCAATGLHAIVSAEPLPTRAVARALEPEERLVAGEEGLVDAVEFYRSKLRQPSERVARLWVPGDREPRMVAVRAFGVQVGPVWIVRPPAEPLYDLAEHLPDAEVAYTERNRTFQCYWQESEQRLFCGGPDYQRVMWSFSEFMGIEADAVLVHPLDDGVLEIRWEEVPLGRKLFGLAGLDDRSIEFSQSPVFVEVSVSNRRPQKLTLGARRGLHSFEVDTASGPRKGPVVIRVTTPDDRGRHLFIDALTIR